MGQLGWTLDHLDDIASDLSVFHRVDDATALDGPRYFKLAWRLAAYAGVMQARVAEARENEQPQASSQAPGTYAGPRQEINPGTAATLMAEPAFAGVFSFG